MQVAGFWSEYGQVHSYLVVHKRVVVDEIDLGELGELDGDVEGEGDDDLEDDDEGPEGQETAPQRIQFGEVEEVRMEGGQGGEAVEPEP